MAGQVQIRILQKAQDITVATLHRLTRDCRSNFTAKNHRVPPTAASVIPLAARLLQFSSRESGRAEPGVTTAHLTPPGIFF